MARIRNLKAVSKRINRHDPVDAEYTIQTVKGEKLINLITYGSDKCKTNGTKQTLLFDENIAYQLYKIFKSEYNFYD
ncbi:MULTISPECIES: hypothetical protein [Paenibacillus]|uniref:Uncharacterized protein n=1 Tax=Paenibacillus polymyxa TaxID=1406 RepID=A0ABX2Z7X5_PAEPO|nr:MULTISPECIES: hypothetical protein [Paenibacillus]ODA07355.1 hypothetical protein A7312_09700 [Paenibacillus polymyxa]OME69626.1 hypothetical protein BK119_14235 [Paenibacillus peoriae]